MQIKSITKRHTETGTQFYDVINANPNNNVLIKTNKEAIVSHNCFFDEIN